MYFDYFVLEFLENVNAIALWNYFPAAYVGGNWIL